MVPTTRREDEKQSISIYKEVCQHTDPLTREITGFTIIIRNGGYNKTWSMMVRMVGTLKRDFPFIKEDDIVIRTYGGDRYARTMGLEVRVPPDTFIPPTYKPVYKLEETLA